SKHRTSRLGDTLRVPKDDIVVVDSRAGITALATRLRKRSIGTYVQLLMGPDPAGASWAPAVTERIDAIALVAPLLTPDAAVLLVADEPADPAHDHRVADGLRLLAEAALSTADHGGATVTVVQEACAEAITRALGSIGAAGVVGPLADFGADRPYADWRTDILSLTSSSDVTYFGWVNQEGTAKVGLLRGSVLSPLAVAPESPVSWGTTEPGARTLGSALLAATLGTPPADDGLVDLFVKDVIGSLPAAGFELTAGEVERWLRLQMR
ncbi:MAG: hypothetical protein LC792_26260, partial [Actinobacteria bacterium]|nr:hypothetical protein [Actinomycetota bacterium]